MSKKNLFHAIVGTKHHVQHKNLAVANIKILYILVKFEPQILRKSIRITVDLQNIHLKIGSTKITILLSTSEKETQQNFLISYGVKSKRRLMWMLTGAF